ncbi:MAG: hypothetical protein Q9217_000110 [Psora testacea]
MSTPTLSPKDPTTTATKTRILTHMNQVHQDSLTRYLEHHHALSSFSARNAKLVDMSLSTLTIHTPNNLGLGFGKGTTTYHIPITPPMESWADARLRTAAMDHAAMDALARSRITIKVYREPYGFMALVMSAVIMTFVCFANRGNFLPGSLFYDVLRLHAVPGFARFCYAIQPYLMALMVGIHLGEAMWMARTRLRRHSVPTGGRLWWTWVLSTFLEGVGSFVRFDGLVREEEEKLAKAKH